MCRVLQVQAIKTTALHPQSNGVVERLNKVITESLRHYVSEKKHEWEKFLQLIMLNHRSSVCRAIKETPYFAVFHRDMSLPTEALLAQPRQSYADNPTLVETLLQDMKVTTDTIRRQNETAKVEAKDYYDRRTQDHSFAVGQRVPAKGLGRKWRKRYDGPFRITDRLDATTFRIRSIFDGKPRVTTVHSNRLKHAYEPDNVVTAQRRRHRVRNAADADSAPALAELQTSTGGESDVSEGVEDAASQPQPRRGLQLG